MKGVASAPTTGFPELDAVLDELVAGARAVLGHTFCGAYLQGSFATGDADEFSDVDFAIVTHDELDADRQHGLQVPHRRLHALPSTWAQHLEGSYIPAPQLRRMDWSRRPFLFLENGANELVWDSHCNTAVARWLLRECGLVLAGPEPALIVDQVSVSDLQREAAAFIQAYGDWAPAPTEAGPMSRWKQTYLVLTFCRLLYTRANGRVASKRDAADWACSALDREWAELIQLAVDDRADPWRRVHQPAERDLAARTLDFAGYVVAEAAKPAAQ